jgi:ArsR family metal-binding transcriptional regulator
MLIPSYELNVFTPPCEPGAERFSAVAFLPTDIREALPYLNATLRGAVYNPAAPALSWRKAGHFVVFQADRIAVSNVEDRQAAVDEVDGLVKLVNRTWERREEIEPDFEARQRPVPMAVFKLLPGTNCRACGQPTCFTFALKLIAGQQKPAECPPLLEPAFAGQLAELQAMLGDMPAFR